jgi:hypothetical protein
MTKYNDSPHYKLNKWIENRLRGIKELDATPVLDDAIIPLKESYITDVDTNDAFGDDDSGFLLPFMTPGGEQAETLSVYNKDNGKYTHVPICVYTIAKNQVVDQPWLLCGQVAYTFYSGDPDKLFEITNFVEDLCKREDWSAYDLNYFYRNDSSYPFDFKKISFLTSSGPMPTEDEGGLYSMLAVVGYDATYEGPGRVGEYGNETSRGMWL